MDLRIKSLLRPPVFSDEDRSRVASILHIISLAILAVVGVIAVVTPFVFRTPAYGLTTSVLIAVLALGMQILVRQGSVRLASNLFVSTLWVFDTVLIYASGGVHSGVVPGYVAVAVLAGLLLDGMTAMAFTGLSAVAGLGMLFAERQGLLGEPLIHLTPLARWLSLTANMALAAVLLYLATQSIDEALERSRRNERALAQANVGLEREIRQRRRAQKEIRRRVEELAALNALGRRAGATLSLKQVVDAALEEVSRPVDPDLMVLFLRQGDELILQGIGPAGTTYTHEETPVHQVGECLCGLVASHGEPLYARDIYTDPRCTWDECKRAGLRSFAALPLASGDEMLGVLGLASATERDFEAQSTFLEALAAQIGPNLQNALLHQEIQRYAEVLEERVAQRTAALEATNQQLETFAYSVSHDLKAPLRGIDGYSRLLLEDHADQLDEEGQLFLHTIRRAADQMRQLIEDLLAYSRLERRSLTTGRVNLQSLMEALVAEHDQEIEARDVEVRVDVPCRAVQADAEGMAQVLRNVFSNALKFTREVAEPEIVVGGRETEGACLLWVRDNGIGFDMRYHDRIFEIFQRLHRAEDYPGTGVGLAIVRKAMRRMGGRVWAESEVGEGATFYVEIPRGGGDPARGRG
jgi:signal transduction histidine kinase